MSRLDDRLAVSRERPTRLEAITERLASVVDRIDVAMQFDQDPRHPSEAILAQYLHAIDRARHGRLVDGRLTDLQAGHELDWREAMALVRALAPLVAEMRRERAG